MTASYFQTSICDTHKLINNLFCYTDNKPICTDCVPSHIDHKIDYLSNRKFEDQNFGSNARIPPLSSTNPQVDSPNTIKYPPTTSSSPRNKLSRNTKSPRLATLDVNPVAPPIRYENSLIPPAIKFQDIKRDSPPNINNRESAPSNILIQIPTLVPLYDNQISPIPAIQRSSPKNTNTIDPLGNSKLIDFSLGLKKGTNINSYPTPSTTNPVLSNSTSILETIQPSIPIVRNPSPQAEIPPPILRQYSPPKIESSPPREVPNYLYKDKYIVFKLDTDSNHFYFFDKDSLMGSKLQISNGMIAPESAMILCFNNILLCGGSDGYSNQTSSSYMIEVEKYSSKNLQNMLIEKRSHTLSKVIENEIYSIGGYSNSQGYLNAVEKYSTISNTWTAMRPINLSRQDVSVCPFSNRFLYCFGGSTSESGNWIFTNLIECFDTQYEVQGWQVFNLTKNDGWTHRVYSGSKQISQTEILLFGGYDGNYLNDVLIVNVVENKISDTRVKLRRPSSFIQRNISIIDIDYWIYAPGFPTLDIHRYSMANNVFEFLDEANWIRSVM